MQRKLTAIQVNEVRKALESLQNTISLLSRTVIGVGGRTYKLENHLHNICEHGTTDGKPWVEPEPEIPPGYRKAEPDEWKRTDVKYWSRTFKEWSDRPTQVRAFDPPQAGTIYIVPIDRDANKVFRDRNKVFSERKAQLDTLKEQLKNQRDLLLKYQNWAPVGYSRGAIVANELDIQKQIAELVTQIEKVCQQDLEDVITKQSPEPLIPEGYRKAKPNEWQRKDVKYWDLCHKDWRPRRSQGIAFDPDSWGTSYIVPIDPPLTDQDACVVPRLLVMVRDHESDGWFGPYKYLGKSKHGYAVDPDNSGLSPLWSQARRATPQEIKQAGLDRSENTAKVEPCRGHDQQGPQ